MTFWGQLKCDLTPLSLGTYLWLVLQTLQRELTGRRARVEEVLDRAGIIASLRTPEVEFVREGAGHVRQLWEVLQLETERRSVMLDAALQAQQYYSEAAKVESWLSGQKLHLVNEEKGTVRTALTVICFWYWYLVFVGINPGWTCKTCILTLFWYFTGRGEHPAAAESPSGSGANSGNICRDCRHAIPTMPASTGTWTPRQVWHMHSQSSTYSPRKEESCTHRVGECKSNIVNAHLVGMCNILIFLNSEQWADHQAAVPHRPAVCVSEGHGGAQEDQAGAAVLALSAQQGGGGVGEVDHWAWGCGQFHWAGPRPRGCHGQSSNFYLLQYSNHRKLFYSWATTMNHDHTTVWHISNN